MEGSFLSIGIIGNALGYLPMDMELICIELANEMSSRWAWVLQALTTRNQAYIHAAYQHMSN